MLCRLSLPIFLRAAPIFCATAKKLSVSCGSLHAMASARTLDTLTFDNVALRELPLDPELQNFTRQVEAACFSKVDPTPVVNPETVVVSLDAFKLLDIPESEVNRVDFPEYFSGNLKLKGSETAAHCYCGHQFGYYSGQLGDGAAIYLGEVINNAGERHEIQIKGAGRTPYSRTADGRKVLRSSIREFLCSEAMHHLGIPTTRAGCVITSDTTVVRDMFYDGNARHEKASQVLRIAPSFIRFGSFEVVLPENEQTGRMGPSSGDEQLLNTLLQYTIRNYYNQIWMEYNSRPQEMYIEFFKEVVRKTACLVAEWQCVGWCHGVLNTDNMSIVGVTIDYGPFGYMDIFNPDFICNSSDDGGRYTYAKQPEICRWNCQKLAEAMAMAVPTQLTLPHLELFDKTFKEHYESKMRQKFGLIENLESDGELIQSFLTTMEATGADFTNAFRQLASLTLPGCEDFEASLQKTKEAVLSTCCSAQQLRASINPQMDIRQLQVLTHLLRTRPELHEVLHKQFQSVQIEIKKKEKLDKIRNLSDGQKKAADQKQWDEWFNKYIERLNQEKCTEEASKKRQSTMNATNPRFILRNYIAQNAIEHAEKGDYSEVRRLLSALQNPYDVIETEAESSSNLSNRVEHSTEGVPYDLPPPSTLQAIKVS